ncbi:MAG: YdcF family protein [Alphaproteobacteria bacterium]|nr:YdcF family protein [Alphaproteobacteria bacterium]
MITILSILLAIMIILPTAPWALTYLENRYPRQTIISSEVVGIIVLGGSFNLKITQARGVTSYNDAAGRIIAFAELARQNPDKRLVFSGRGVYEEIHLNESHITRELFKNLGLEVSKMIFEDQSKNTFENAVFSAKILKPHPKEKWILVTSASHMPRAMGLFRKAGFNIIPYPVDYHTTGNYNFKLSLDLWGHLQKLSTAFHEYWGLTQNYVKGRSDEWIPKLH